MPRLSQPRARPTACDLEADLPPRMPATELIAADLPERQIVLDPILATKSLALLYGPRGVGKTFVALGIAWAVASGGSFLGWRPAGRTACSMSTARWRRSTCSSGCSSSARRRRRSTSCWPTSAGAPARPRHGEGQSRLVEGWGHPEFVVLDNLSSLVGFRTGDPDCWPELQRFLMQAAPPRPRRADGPSRQQQGMQRGTSRREDVLDLVMALRRPPTTAQGRRALRDPFREGARPLRRRRRPDRGTARDRPGGVARWSWRPVQLGELERVAALLRQGLKPNRVAQELGIAQSYCYRLSERARASGLVQ